MDDPENQQPEYNENDDNYGQNNCKFYLLNFPTPDYFNKRMTMKKKKKMATKC